MWRQKILVLVMTMLAWAAEVQPVLAFPDEGDVLVVPGDGDSWIVIPEGPHSEGSGNASDAYNQANPDVPPPSPRNQQRQGDGLSLQRIPAIPKPSAPPRYCITVAGSCVAPGSARVGTVCWCKAEDGDVTGTIQ